MPLGSTPVQLAATREHLRVPESDEFLGRIWGRRQPGFTSTERGSGQVWLFKHRIGLIFRTGAPVVLPIAELRLLRRTLRTAFRKGSFAAQPQRMYIMQLAACGDASTLTLEFEEHDRGEQLGRAIDLLWRWRRDRLTERETVYLACNKLEDVVACVAVLPLSVAGTLTVRDGPQQTRLGDAMLELALDQRATLSFYKREAQHIEGEVEPLLAVPLDSVVLLRRDRRKNVLFKARDETREIVFAVGSDVERVVEHLQRVWGLNCSSLVTFTLHNATRRPHGRRASIWRPNEQTLSPRKVAMLDDVVCFSLDEITQLQQTFQSIDCNVDGHISAEEFCASLGPAFSSGVEAQVPLAVFRVFDANRDGMITFPEFLFGCRILRLGSKEDRLNFQCRLFDVDGTGFVNKSGFMAMTKTLTDVGAFVISGTGGAQEFCDDVFARLDLLPDGTVQAEDFIDRLQVNASFRDAFGTLAGMQRKLQDTAQVRGGRQVMFGDGAWLTGTCILSGVQKSVQHREDCCGRGPPGKIDASDLNDKVTWSLTSGKQVHGNPPKSSPPKGVQASPANCEVFFTDYSPQVFHDMMRLSGLTGEEYLDSLGIRQMVASMLLGVMTSLVEISSSGRSGAFFFASHDGRFILKTIPAGEAATLQRILPFYHAHILAYPDTLLTRYYGLHSLRYGSVKLNFVVMENVMQPRPGYEVTQQFDLKGSTTGRTVPHEQRRGNVALKDLDLKRPIEIDPDLQPILLRQLEADSIMLKEANLNDYSFLLGIHTKAEPIPPPAVQDRFVPVLRRWYGGIPSADRTEVFFGGIIDVLTAFGWVKKGEHAVKSIQSRISGGKPEDVSCVPPDQYQERFMRFLAGTLRAGRASGGPRPDVSPLQREPRLLYRQDSVQASFARPAAQSTPQAPASRPARHSTGELGKTLPQFRTPPLTSVAEEAGPLDDGAGGRRRSAGYSGSGGDLRRSRQSSRGQRTQQRGGAEAAFGAMLSAAKGLVEEYGVADSPRAGGTPLRARRQ
eukprot:TRINITY_DN23844_c0_g1_i2.p1 TRINITY_DN23844_c0_g1~~TRINITY_DN23844_c0_g1_i2.p1  ORF type:complete len:1033 (+),score=380.30 TRINITY_DN23844_c0_g1_i2:61-3099(+)